MQLVDPDDYSRVIRPALYLNPPRDRVELGVYSRRSGCQNDDQQKIIGDMTNTLLDSLPPDQRKAYLLAPEVLFNMQSLVNRILEAEGITPEMQEKQQAKAQLIQEFLQVKDEEALRALVKEHDPELDYEFFQMLTALAQAASEDGRPDTAQALLGLDMTQAERLMIQANLEDQREELFALRLLELPNSVPPALVLRPWPAGWAPPVDGPAPVWSEVLMKDRPEILNDLAYASVGELAYLLESRQVTSLELTRLSLDRLRVYGRELPGRESGAQSLSWGS